MSINSHFENQLAVLRDKLNHVCRSDYFRLRARVNRLARDKDKNLSELNRQIEIAVERFEWRNAHVPVQEYQTILPIFEKKAEIQELLAKNQVLIICGETGSGKTTQLPLYCLEAGRGVNGVIGHTQPRRIAARTVSKRIAESLQSTIGEAVGYKIRHQDLSTDKTYIKLMTDGILLSEMQSDRYLNQYDTLIIDEAHERSLNIDFILGYIKQLLPKRPDLKVIVTSATIDVKRFSEFFNQAPIIEVSGKTYPVDVLYRPIDEEGDDDARLKAIADAVSELSTFDMGDILIFLEGEGEIHETDKYLSKLKLNDTDILPLYARLSTSRQSKIFGPHKRRHIVLATNVAETSLTIPGIRYVIDIGKARVSRYSAQSKVQRLPIEKISRAAANQRKGRCGRTSDGICIRLYSEEDFLSRTEFTQPEILRTNLASVILQMKVLGLGDIKAYPFLEAPNDKLINDGLNVLKEINAINQNESLTRQGRKIARIPIEPRYARMLLAAAEYNCVSELLIIVSVLSIQDPRERPLDNIEKADKAHKQFNDENSDFLWFVNLWNFYHNQLNKLSQNKLRKLCNQNFISYIRMREWLDIHRQLRHVSTELKLPLNRDAANYQSLHCAILTGLASYVAYLSDKHVYTGARNVQSYLFPASILFEKKPKWVVSAELVETSKLYARNSARIESQWVIHTAKHLLKYSYSDIRWERADSRIVAKETILLYGMTLSADKTINYGKINAKESRKLFIQRALVDLEFDSHSEIFTKNKKTIDEIREIEIRTRRPDMLNESAVYDFHDAKLPDDVFDGHSYERWSAKLNKSALAKYLFIKKDIIFSENTHYQDAYYPDTLSINNISLPLEYKFVPGNQHDGVTVDVPLETLKQYHDQQFDYLVPGLLKEKIICLLKSLPKSIRKQLVPVPDVAEEFIKNIKQHKSGLKDALAAYLYRTRGISIESADWSNDGLPEHLKFNFRVIDQNQNIIAEERSLEILHEKLSIQSDSAFNKVIQTKQGSKPITQWDFGDIPVSEQLTAGETSFTVYPALIEDDGEVYRRAFDSLEAAEHDFKLGLRALYKSYLKSDLKYLSKYIRDIDKLTLRYSAIGARSDLVESFVNQIIDEVFLFEQKAIRKQEEFFAKLEQGRGRILLQAEKLSVLLNSIFENYNRINIALAELNYQLFDFAIDDINEQLAYLIYNGFIEDFTFHDLNQYPRYLESILKRLEKLEYSLEKDKKHTEAIKPHWNRIKQLVDNAYNTGEYSPILNEYRWLMEEWRISLFTQELKTQLPVSLKRMDKKWQTLQDYNR